MANPPPVARRRGVSGGRPLANDGSRPITYTAAPLPTGLSLQGATISGTPAMIGTTKATLTATNADGGDITTLTITISEARKTHLPLIRR
ncbi:MAG TPA: putative Ig domain-containing protein [Roseiflexaceae bacterium]